jgi:hypothetical protein
MALQNSVLDTRSKRIHKSKDTNQAKTSFNTFFVYFRLKITIQILCSIPFLISVWRMSYQNCSITPPCKIFYNLVQYILFFRNC